MRMINFAMLGLRFFEKRVLRWKHACLCSQSVISIRRTATIIQEQNFFALGGDKKALISLHEKAEDVKE